MQEISSITGEHPLKKFLRNIALCFLSILTFSSGAAFAAAALSVEGASHTHQHLVSGFSLRSVSFRTITKEAFSFAHTLPALGSKIASLGRPAVQSIPTDHSTGITFMDRLPEIVIEAPVLTFQIPAFPTYTLEKSTAKKVTMLHSEQREIAVAGMGTSRQANLVHAA
jgi:hypothetical protein